MTASDGQRSAYPFRGSLDHGDRAELSHERETTQGSLQQACATSAPGNSASMNVPEICVRRQHRLANRPAPRIALAPPPPGFGCGERGAHPPQRDGVRGVRNIPPTDRVCKRCCAQRDGQRSCAINCITSGEVGDKPSTPETVRTFEDIEFIGVEVMCARQKCSAARTAALGDKRVGQYRNTNKAKSFASRIPTADPTDNLLMHLIRSSTLECWVASPAMSPAR